MKVVKIVSKAGSFAENKDIARDIRIQKITPVLQKGQEIILDFERVDSVTQSFMHALLSEILREYGGDALDKILFKNCNDSVKGIINIVVDYMQA